MATKTKVPERATRKARSDLNDGALDFSSSKDVEKSMQRKKKKARTGFDDDDVLPPKERKASRPRRAESAPRVESGKTVRSTKTTTLAVVKKGPVKTAVAEAPVKKTRTKSISKNGGLSLTSIMGDDAESLQQLLENDSDSVHNLIHKRLLQSLIDMVAHAEHNVRTSNGQKGVYAFNSLITSIRELLIDVQSTRDKGLLGNTIVEQTIRPNFLDIGMDYVRDTEILKTRLRGILPNDVYQKVAELQDTFTSNFAQSLQTRYALIQESIIKHLQG